MADFQKVHVYDVNINPSSKRRKHDDDAAAAGDALSAALVALATAKALVALAKANAPVAGLIAAQPAVCPNMFAGTGKAVPVCIISI